MSCWFGVCLSLWTQPRPCLNTVKTLSCFWLSHLNLSWLFLVQAELCQNQVLTLSKSCLDYINLSKRFDLGFDFVCGICLDTVSIFYEHFIDPVWKFSCLQSLLTMYLLKISCFYCSAEVCLEPVLTWCSHCESVFLLSKIGLMISTIGLKCKIKSEIIYIAFRVPSSLWVGRWLKCFWNSSKNYKLIF